MASQIVLPVHLYDESSGHFEPAELVAPIQERHLVDTETLWAPELASALGELCNALSAEGRLDRKTLDAACADKHLQDAHWRWRDKDARYGCDDSAIGVALECAGCTQGLMYLTSGYTCQLAPDKGEDLLYVDFIAVAPWNRRQLYGGQKKYTGIGTTLMFAAVRLSMSYGLNGRLGLHSLPQADTFYADVIGMSDGGFDHANGMRYFELSAQDAAAILREDDS